jgi:hypothetical protein
MIWRPDIAVAIVGASLGLGALLGVPAQISAIADVQSPAFFPILIALVLVAVSVLLLTARRLGPSKPGEITAPAEGDETGPVEAPRRLAAAALCLVAYYAALELIGMVPASVLAIAALALTLGYRRYGILAAVALALPVGIFLAFEKGLFVLLPAGKLF